jgi:hypothetical protein
MMATNTEDSNPRPPDDTSAIQPNGWLQKMLVWIISQATPKCRDVVRILSEQMDHELPVVMRLKLRLHFLACCWCERYMKQLHCMRETARRFPEHTDEAGGPVLSPEARFRLKHVLNNQ